MIMMIVGMMMTIIITRILLVLITTIIRKITTIKITTVTICFPVHDESGTCRTSLVSPKQPVLVLCPASSTYQHGHISN